MKRYITILLLCAAMFSCHNTPPYIPKWEITIDHGIVGYVYHCDSYVKIGNSYYLYSGKKLSHIIDCYGNATIVIEPNTEPEDE